MAAYLCQFCNEIVIYGENHECTFYENDNKVYSVPQLDESNKKHVKTDEAKDGFAANSSEDSEQLYAAIQQNDNEEYQEMSSLENENNEVSFMLALTRKRKFVPLSKETSYNANFANQRDTSLLCSASNIRTNEVHSEESISCRVSSENFEIGCKSENDFLGNYKINSSTTGVQNNQHKCETFPSNSIDTAPNEEYEISLEKIKCHSLTEDKKLFMDSVDEVIQKALSDSKNIHRTTNFPVSPTFSLGSEGLSKELLDMSGDLTNTLILPRVASHVLTSNREMAANVEKPLNSMKHASAMTTPSGVQTELLRAEKKSFPRDVFHSEFDERINYYNRHEINTGEKPFECEMCEKRFTEKKGLDRHYKIHSGEKSYVCDKCQKEFARKDHFDRHYRIHSGEKSCM